MSKSWDFEKIRRVESSDISQLIWHRGIAQKISKQDMEIVTGEVAYFTTERMTPFDVQNVFKGIDTVLFTTRDDGSIYGIEMT